MPLVVVEFVTDEETSPTLAQSLADEIGTVLDSAPNGTWLRLTITPTSRYAENGGNEVRPIFVTVTSRDRPSTEKLRGLAPALTTAVAKTTQVPTENVHIIFEESGMGRIAFGGRLVGDQDDPTHTS